MKKMMNQSNLKNKLRILFINIMHKIYRNQINEISKINPINFKISKKQSILKWKAY